MSFRELLFLHKDNTMAILLKTTSIRVFPFKSCKLESKTRAKVFGKVDTLETYQQRDLSHLWQVRGEEVDVGAGI